MLSGQALGAAIKSAMKLKKVTQKKVAEEFGIAQPSVSHWIKTGRIDKEHLDHLFDYFADVAGPDHWGITSRLLNARYVDVIDVAARVVADEQITDEPRSNLSAEALSAAMRLDQLPTDARAMALEMIEVILSRLTPQRETKQLESKTQRPQQGPRR